MPFVNRFSSSSKLYNFSFHIITYCKDSFKKIATKGFYHEIERNNEEHIPCKFHYARRIPSEILEPFYKGKFNPLSEREQMFLDLFRGKENPFYVIGTYGNARSDTLKHEIAHGLFYTNQRYKEEVLKILEKIDKKRRAEINRFLNKWTGYHPQVWDDETHAFILLSKSKKFKEGVDVSSLSKIKRALNLIFEKYHQEN